jgi:hypothetical protein
MHALRRHAAERGGGADRLDVERELDTPYGA